MPISESFEQYGRAKEPRRHKNNQQQNQQQEQQQDKRAKFFIDRFVGERVKVTLINGKSFTGVLESTPANKYELLVGDTFLYKHACAIIEKLSDGDVE